MKTVRRSFHNESTGGKKAAMKKHFLNWSFFADTVLLSLVIVSLHLSGCRDKDTKLSNVHSSIAVYEGAKTCDKCHPGVIADLRASTHYRFLSELPDNYVYDNAAASTPVAATHAGKMTKI
jgi:hypothetical protein